jgi:hypothetical protein
MIDGPLDAQTTRTSGEGPEFAHGIPPASAEYQKINPRKKGTKQHKARQETKERRNI